MAATIRKGWRREDSGTWVYKDGTTIRRNGGGPDSFWSVRWPIQIGLGFLEEGAGHMGREQAMRHVENGQPTLPWVRPRGGKAHRILEDVAFAMVASHRKLLEQSAEDETVETAMTATAVMIETGTVGKASHSIGAWGEAARLELPGIGKVQVTLTLKGKKAVIRDLTAYIDTSSIEARTKIKAAVRELVRKAGGRIAPEKEK